MKTSILISMNICSDAPSLFGAWPAPDVVLSRMTTDSIKKSVVGILKASSMIGSASRRTLYSQIRHSYGMGDDMGAYPVFVSNHVAAEDLTACNRNDGVSVAPALNDTFYQAPHLVSLKRSNDDTLGGMVIHHGHRVKRLLRLMCSSKRS